MVSLDYFTLHVRNLIKQTISCAQNENEYLTVKKRIQKFKQIKNKFRWKLIIQSNNVFIAFDMQYRGCVFVCRKHEMLKHAHNLKLPIFCKIVINSLPNSNTLLILLPYLLTIYTNTWSHGSKLFLIFKVVIRQ